MPGTWYYPAVTLSVVVISLNEEANIGRTLESVQWADEILLVDSGSTDRTVEIARSLRAQVFTEPWKGMSAQKNSAMDKATCDWVLQLDADEVVEPRLREEIQEILRTNPPIDACWIPFKHHFMGRWMRHGGFYPDHKIRMVRRGRGRYAERIVHPAIEVSGPTRKLSGALLHYGYPDLHYYLGHMNQYSTESAQVLLAKGARGFNPVNILLRPVAQFLYNYVFRLGFLDGREGLLLHLYHAVYVSWKYAKAWELSRRRAGAS